jgi:MarR family transcriptional regulator, temperature-dependent positive regulator of motility
VTDAVPKTVNFEFDDMVGFLIRVSQQVHASLWGSEIGVSALTSPQFAVLHVLAHEDPLDQTTVGARASLDRTTVASVITRLARRQFVARDRDKIDGRRNLVRMTDAGRAAHAVASRAAYNINETLLTSVAQEDRDALIRILSEIILNRRGSAYLSSRISMLTAARECR